MNADRVSHVAAPFQFVTWPFLAACTLAGTLAVPMDPVASPVSMIVAGSAGFCGLRLWRWSGLPGLVTSNTNGTLERVRWPIVSLGYGLLVGLMLLVVIRLAVEPSVPAAGARIAAAGALPIWRGLVIIYVAAVGEEVVFRLVLVSAVAGLTMRLLRPGVRIPSRAVILSSIGLSAFSFAAAHLPAWNRVESLSLGLALLVVTLNGLGGVVFGYVFVTRGIAAATWAHAGADCVIQLIGPLT